MYTHTPVQFTMMGPRLHLNHGPIDLIIEAWGDAAEIEHAYQAARARFETVLGELVGELDRLRTPILEIDGLEGPIARRMYGAALPFADVFLTPMVAVAGSVADEILAVMNAAARLEKAYVNNGGDIAVWVGEGNRLDIAMVRDLEQAYGNIENGSSITIAPDSGIGGIATSSWRGRSLSLGIADMVTVAARNAASADAAATLIANAVDVETNAVVRVPADRIDPDSDLGARPVTVEVGALDHRQIDQALDAGLALAWRFSDQGLIGAAALSLRGAIRLAGDGAFDLPAPSAGRLLQEA